ncbi:MAG TPA: UDP-N-acetylmuramate dehydrogenase [Tepidisphaeraceae bacterium]|nr:UDP-N-acetylmuramate dehydrogenase [Tepidisphaeraceae bacterium]
MMRIVAPFAGLETFVTENAPLARYTWFKLGGPARWLIRPRNLEELQEATLRCNENQIPIYILGLGANLLVNDAGVNGAVIRLSEEYWQRIQIQDNTIHAGAGADLQKLLLKLIRAGKSGLEGLAGIPGTVGGSIRMNAGGKFGNIGSAVSSVTVMDTQNTVFERTRDDLIFTYRSTNIVAKYILGATLQVEDDDPHRVMQRTKEVWMFKQNSQPLNAKSAGCIFKNPPEHSAGALIDRAGLKGMRVGGAEVSQKHANFIIANPGCTADNVMTLLKVIRDTVAEKFGVTLEPEVQLWP